MAWLYIRGGTWWVGWRHEGKLYARSTKQRDKSEAEKEKLRVDAMFLAHRTRTLTEEVYSILTRRNADPVQLADYLDAWLKDSEGSTAPGTMMKYRQVIREFKEHTLAAKTALLLSDVTPEHLKAFFNWKRERSALSTVAGFRRILRSIFIQAQEEGKINGNPVHSANRAKNRVADRKNETTRKRPFNLEEIKTLHSLANPFWKYMIQVGFFTGMRMGDAVTLQRANLDLVQNRISFVSRKTGKRTIVPLHPQLREILRKFANEKSEEYFWPEQAQRYITSGASAFSQEFYELMAKTGIVKPRDPKKLGRGRGRDAKREQTPIGYHNLRHTFVSMLKLSGANDAIAKELAGHRSDAVNAEYTHLPHDTLAEAIKRLPLLGRE